MYLLHPQDLNAGSCASDLDASDDDDDVEFGHAARRFCTNCTGRMVKGNLCEDCGHSAAMDASLFSTEASGNPCSSHSTEQKVALLYDERMELHVEGGHTPHPERPDRIRAVVARLLASGLGGESGSLHILYLCLPDHLILGG